MEKKQTLLLVAGAVIILLILLAILFVPNDNQETTVIEEKKNADEVSTSTDSDIIVIGEDGVPSIDGGNVEIVEIENQAEIIAPLLNRPISIPEYFGSDGSKLMATKLADTVASLEEDASSFQKWLTLGNLRYQIEDYEGAEEIYEYLAVVKADSSVPFVNIGNLNHYHLKDFAKSEVNYLKAIEISPNEETAYVELHTMYRNVYKIDTDRAEQILKEGLMAKPESINYMMLLANYYGDRGEKDLQLDYLNKALNEANRTGDTALVERLNTEIKSL